MGPWGAFKISQDSQVARFRSVLEQVRANGNTATGAQYLQLTSIVTYLAQRKAVSRLDPLTELDVNEISKDTSSMAYARYDFMAGQKLLDSMGITVEPEDYAETTPNMSFNYYTDWNKNLKYSVAGFTDFAMITYQKPEYNPMFIGGFRVQLNSASGELYLFEVSGEQLVLKVPLKERMLALSRYGPELQYAPEQEFILEVSTDSVYLKMIVLDLNFTRDGNSVQFNQLRALLFLKHS
jgi:hypothetical protein